MTETVGVRWYNVSGTKSTPEWGHDAIRTKRKIRHKVVNV